MATARAAVTFFLFVSGAELLRPSLQPAEPVWLEEHMLSSGRVVFGEIDEVVFGKPAADAVAQQAQRLGATRVFLMVT